MNNKRIGACILAAGYSSRMGAFKATLPLGDSTVIERVIAAVQAAGISDITVVTGYNREALDPYTSGLRQAYNPDFAEGMFTSIQAGIRAAEGTSSGLFLLPVDCPLVDAAVIKEMIARFESGQDFFYVPCYRGKKGHPLLIPALYYEEILRSAGKGGLKGITDRDYSKLIRVDVDSEGILLDMDDQAGYEEVKDFLENGCKSENLPELAEGRRFFLIRHGQIAQHAEKIFLGQTDVPLSDLGRQQAEDAARKLSKYDLCTDTVYTSDLARATETAAAISFLNPIPDGGLREMALGTWDGQYISQIQRLYPEEYKKRGEHLFIYKMGHGSENFYDLQYRVWKTLVKILKKDQRRDIVITAHSGVLRSIEQNLRGKGIEEPWAKMGNGELRIIEIPKACE